MITTTESTSVYFKLVITEHGEEIARAHLFLVQNDLHDTPYGLLEDVYVSESHRGKGLGTKLVQEVIAKAKEQSCYKLIATSRFGREAVHRLYKDLGFIQHGIEFRMDI